MNDNSAYDVALFMSIAFVLSRVQMTSSEQTRVTRDSQNEVDLRSLSHRIGISRGGVQDIEAIQQAFIPSSVVRIFSDRFCWKGLDSYFVQKIFFGGSHVGIMVVHLILVGRIDENETIS